MNMYASIQIHNNKSWIDRWRMMMDLDVSNEISFINKFKFNQLYSDMPKIRKKE